MTITQSSTRLLAIAAGSVLALGLVFGVLAAPARAAALSQTQISSILSLLSSFGADQATINNVSAALNGQATTGTTGGSTGTASGGVCPFTWTRTLKVGSSGADVKALQMFLNMSADTQVSASGAGSPGMETSTFGPATKAAVNKFQAKYSAQILAPVGLTSPTGTVGAGTRAQLNALCGGSSTGTTGSTGGTTTTGTGTGGAATVTAGAQPANLVAPKNAARVPVTSFTVTAQGSAVTLNSVTVQRQGVAVDTDISGVELIDTSTGVQLGISRVLDSNHSATIGSAVTIPAGTSKTFQVALNVAATPNTGDIASFAVTAVNTNGPVTASLPISGASVTFNANLAIGTNTATVSSFDPNAAISKSIGTTAYRFSGIHLAADATEDQTLKSVTWFQSGSATGISNVVTVVNGTSYPTTVDATGRYYTTVFPSGIVIPKGQSTDAYVQGDIGAGAIANTSAEFDIYRATDVYLVGNTYGYGITVSANSVGTYSTSGTHASGFQATSNPWFFGSTLSITAGTVSTVQNATAVASQNIAVNVPNQVLGGFQTNLLGEGVTAQNVVLHFNTSWGSTNLLTNVSLVDENGAIVAGPFNAVAVAGNGQKVTFSGSITFPVGTHTYTVKGELPSTGPVSGSTVQASTTPSTDWTSVTGATTGNTITLPSTLVTMNQMTVKAATLSVTNSSAVTSQTVVAGANGFKMATIQLDASQSGEDVRISSIPLTFTFGAPATNADLSGCQIYNGSTALNAQNVKNTTDIASGAKTNFTLDSSLTVPKGTIIALDVKCNVSSAATGGTYNVAADTTSGDYTVTGVTSGNTVTVTGAGGAALSGNTGTAPTMTVSSGGTFTATVDSSSPAKTVAAAGTTGVTLSVIKFHATNEAINLTKIGLALGGSTHAADLSNVYLYGPTGTLLGTAQFTGGSTHATSTLTTSLNLSANSDTLVTVKGDLAAIGTNLAGVSGDLIQVNPDAMEGVGASSGTTKDIQGSGSAAGLIFYRSYPTFTQSTSASAISGTIPNIITLSVSAPTSNPISLYKLTFSVATTTATLTSPTFTGPNGSVSSSSPILTGTQMTVFFDSTSNSADATVGAGQTKTFNLGGTLNLTGTNSTGSVSIALKADSALPSFDSGALAATSSITSKNVNWSPNSTTSPIGITNDDWTDAYGLPGCYLTSGLGTDCFATTIAK